MKKVLAYSLVFLFFACNTRVPSTGVTRDSSTSEEIDYESVSVLEAETMDVVLVNEYPGYLSADNAIELVARVSGYLSGVYYKPGEYVKKGKLLFRIEPTMYENAVNQANGQLLSAKAQLTYTTTNYERSVEAAKSDAISEIDVLQAKSAMEEAQAAVIEAQAALSTAKTNLSYCYIKAPENGSVSVNLYANGSYINGSASPIKLASIYDNKIQYVNFTIPDKILPLIGNLDSLTITYGEHTESFKGKIDYISPNVNLQTGTLNIRAKIYNKNGILRDGLYVTVKLPYKKEDGAVVVHNDAIGTNQSGSFLYVLEKDGTEDIYTVILTHVQTGSLINDSLRIIASGLEANTLYVSKALLKVNDGEKVVIKK